ncbi:hypothetical protein ACA910_002745 [Epithemia clementina (nom. ined.)]
MSSSSNLADAETEWAVHLYRKTSSFGWQVLEARRNGQQQQATTATEPTASPAQLQRQSRKRRAVSLSLFASPRKEAIIVRGLRLRINIEPGSTVVTRRKNRITIESEQGTRSLMLLFPSITECQAFSDRLVQLNPLPCMLRAELSGSEAIGEEQGENAASAANQIDESAASRILQSHLRGVDHEEVVSYIARLIEMPDFRSYLEKLESLLENHPNGRLLVQDYEWQPQPQDPSDGSPRSDARSSMQQRERDPNFQFSQAQDSLITTPWPGMNYF